MAWQDGENPGPDDRRDAPRAGEPARSDVHLAEIAVPTLILAGGGDQVIPLDESIAMGGAIPGARHVVIGDSGHLAPIENPSATNAAILEFLQTLW